MEFITMDNQDEIDAYEQAQEDLYAAEQAIIDAAAVFESQYHEHDGWAFVPLGQMQDLMTCFDNWRKVGGQTTDERDDALDMLYGKGTGVKAPAVS